MKSLNILLAVQHPVLCDGLEKILADEPHFKVQGTAKNRDELFNLPLERENILILDLGKTDSETSAIIKKLLDNYPQLNIIVLRSNTGTNVQQVMQAGASGYIFKKNSSVDLIKGLKSVQEGERYLCAEAVRLLIESRDSSGTKDDLPDELTHRETEVLSLICQEFTNREIAEKLYISVRTVDTHRRNILQKTGAKNTAGLVKYAIRNQVYTL